MDELFQDYQGEETPGAAVMVISQREPVLVQCYGMADLEKKIPVSERTNFRLASVTKQFTAMGIMILVKQGKLDYADTLTKIFPDFPEYGNQITVRHLLQHTSGLKSYESLIPDSATEQVKDEDVLRMMKQQEETLFEPGTDYQYSNSGYAVLAKIIEKVSGKSFADFLDEEIFQSLGMENTVVHEEGVSTVANRAYGYRTGDGAVEFSDQSLTSAVQGDGGVYSSLDDLFKWDQALYTEKLVPAEMLQEAFTPGLNNYGFGWRIKEYEGMRQVSHTGSTCGFRTVIQRYPEEAFSVMILTNRREPNVAPLAEKVVDLYLFGEEEKR